MLKLKIAFSFLNTVSKNKKLFKNQEVRKSTDAIMINRKTNFISKDKFSWIVKDNWIQNDPITVGGVRRYHKFYEPPYRQLKG